MKVYRMRCDPIRYNKGVHSGYVILRFPQKHLGVEVARIDFVLG